MSIEFKVVDQKTIDNDTLNHFDREQHTDRVLFFKEGSLFEKEDHFSDIWDQEKKENVCEYLYNVNGVVVFAYDEDKVIGFANIEQPIFDGYINLPFCHISKEYRGLGLGKKLLDVISKEALKLEVQKLYISTHPSVESQGFYKSYGCVLAEQINDELLAIEPLDIQLEKSLFQFKLEKMIDEEFKKLGKINASTIQKVSTKFLKHVKNIENFNDIVEYFIRIQKRGFYSIATNWMKMRKDFNRQENLTFLERLLTKYVTGWGQVDQICYRSLNPVIELQESNYDYLLKWSESSNKDVRRASLVSMIRSSGRLTLEYDYDKMIHLVEKLKNDDDFHVKKAVGWTLKCAFPTYPKKVEKYLRDNVKNLDRLIFRYALEHVENPLRKELIELDYKE